MGKKAANLPGGEAMNPPEECYKYLKAVTKEEFPKPCNMLGLIIALPD